MKIISEKISRHHAPGRGPFRGIVHCETDSTRSEPRLRGNPSSLEFVADYQGRRFTVRLDAAETATVALLLAHTQPRP